MTVPSLFIGVVSYEGTRYVQAQGPEGLAARLAAAIRERGRECTVVVDTSNRLNTAQDPVSGADVQAALSAQVRLEDEWDRYIRASHGSNARGRAHASLRWLRRGWQRLVSPGTVMVERLLNIELAHLDLLRQGIASRAPWILILEDDAWSADIDDLADGLTDLLARAETRVQFMNLSESFDLSDLGINHLLGDSDCSWHGSGTRAVLTAERPVTNTVCAIAYRSSFAEQLLDAYASIPMRPVVPIDWKLNRALMDMHSSGSLGAGSCWWVVPGPIDQLSMRNSP